MSLRFIAISLLSRELLRNQPFTIRLDLVGDTNDRDLKTPLSTKILPSAILHGINTRRRLNMGLLVARRPPDYPRV
jgi:hypothetical protein